MSNYNSYQQNMCVHLVDKLKSVNLQINDLQFEMHRETENIHFFSIKTVSMIDKNAIDILNKYCFDYHIVRTGIAEIYPTMTIRFWFLNIQDL